MNIEHYFLSDSFLLPCVLSAHTCMCVCVDLISVLLLTCRRLELFFLFPPFFFKSQLYTPVSALLNMRVELSNLLSIKRLPDMIYEVFYALT